MKTFRELVENEPDFIVRFDRELRHLYVNPAVEHVTGIPVSQFIGKTNEQMSMPAELCSFWAEHDLRKTLDELDMCIRKKTSKLEETNKILSLEIDERKKAEKEREKLILELREALSKIKLLSGFLPICSPCKKIRNDNGYREQIEIYIRDHSEAEFSHSICPECAEKLYPDYYKKK